MKLKPMLSRKVEGLPYMTKVEKDPHSGKFVASFDFNGLKLEAKGDSERKATFALQKQIERAVIESKIPER